MADPLNYHMKLHYSQTLTTSYNISCKLNYHMKLHYSQTSAIMVYIR